MKARRWIGKWIAAVGGIHSLLGLIGFAAIWKTLATEGFFNTVNGQADREFATWFVVSGVMMIFFGVLLDRAEKASLSLPVGLRWGFLALVLGLLLIMPISGGWLLLPPALGLVRYSAEGRS